MKKLFYKALVKSAGRGMKGNWRLGWLGLFVAGGSFWLQFGVGDWSKFLPEVFKNGSVNFSGFWQAEWPGLWALVVILLVAFIFSLINFGARAGLLKGFQAIQKNEPYGLGSLAAAGGRKIGRLLLLEILLGIPVVILMIPLVFHWGYPQISLWTIIAIVAGVLLGLYSLLVYFFRHYAYCRAVLEGQGAWKAIGLGFNLFKNNPGSLILAKLLELGLRILINIGLVIVISVIILIFGLLGILFMALGAGAAIVPLIIIGLAVVFVGACFVQALANTFFQSYLTNVYWAIQTTAGRNTEDA